MSGPRLVLGSMRPSGRRALLLVAAVAAATVLPVLTPQFTRRFVDGAIAGLNAGELLAIAGLYLATAVAALAARAATGWLANGLAWDGTNRLREQLAAHTLSLDLSFHTNRTPGEMIERVDGDIVAMGEFVVAFLLDVVVSVLLLLGVLISVFVINVWLGVVLAVYSLLAMFGLIHGQRLAVPTATRSRAASAALYGQVEETLAGAEDIRANGAGRYMVDRFYRTSAAWYRAEFLGARVGTSVLAGVSAAFAIGSAIVLAVTAWLLHADTLTVGTAVLLFQYSLMVRSPFERLAEQARGYQGALASMARIADLLGRQPALSQPAFPQRVPADGALEVRLEGVTFSYGKAFPAVVSEVDLILAPGETLGLIGRTGSGKTTIARLLTRLYDPCAGVVRVGGIDLRQADQICLRRRIGMVTQDVQLFHASIRDNLTLWRPLADDDRLREVLHEVGLGSWLGDQPDGLDTVLAGAGLSGGEAQLLAFARVLLTDPGLVILDEPSSRLDLATEVRIENSIDRLLCGRTGVIIAHRLSSLSRVDKVAVIDAGRIVEHGSRNDLAADPQSRFARMLDLAKAGS